MNEQRRNDVVTKDCNVDLSRQQKLSKRLRQFLDKARDINLKQLRPFSYLDFPELKAGYFRKIVHELRNELDLVIDSRPRFWKVKGAELSVDTHNVTYRHMGDKMMTLLQNLVEQPPKVHDLKFRFGSNLHEKLVQKGCSVNPSNKGILVNVPPFDNNITTKAMVYPETVQIDVGCTFKPFVYDISGVLDLTFYLGRVHGYLHLLSTYKAEIPPVREWIVTQYHFGRDGTQTYSGDSFNMTYEDASNGLVRFYSKIMPDGNVIPRLEQIQTPKISLEQGFLLLLNGGQGR